MVRLATRGNGAFEVTTQELDTPGPSFTIDTLRAVAGRYPRARLFLLMGADSLEEFRTWRSPREILERATVAVAARPGSGRAATLAWARRHGVMWLGNPGLEVSSSLVRERARGGRSLRYLVSDPVARYIARHRLYRGRG